MEHESVESLRRWLREKEDEIAQLRSSHLTAEKEIERLRALVYAYPPSDPYAPDGVTWQQEAERLRQENEVFKEQLTHWVAEDHKWRELLRPFAALPVNALGQCQRHPDEPVFAINGVSFTATDVLRVREALGNTTTGEKQP